MNNLTKFQKMINGIHQDMLFINEDMAKNYNKELEGLYNQIMLDTELIAGGKLASLGFKIVKNDE